MAVEPTGVYGTGLKLIRDLIAASDSFQAWCGIDPEDADAATQAAAFIFWETVAQGDATRPFVVIEIGESSWEKTGGGGSNVYMPGGSATLQFEADFATDDEDVELGIPDATVTFVNSLDAIIADMMNGAAVNGAIDLSGLSRGKPMRSDPQEGSHDGNFLACTASVSWGR